MSNREMSPFKIAVVTYEDAPDIEVHLCIEKVPDKETAHKIADLLAAWLTENGRFGWTAKVQ